MNDSSTYSHSYARVLLAATPRHQLLEPEKPKKLKGLDEEQMARMENEMANLQKEFHLIQDSYLLREYGLEAWELTKDLQILFYDAAHKEAVAYWTKVRDCMKPLLLKK